MDGTPYAGPGGYTNQSIRELYQARIRDKKPWGKTGDYADTSEGAERAVGRACRRVCAVSHGRRAADRQEKMRVTSSFFTMCQE